MTPPFSFPSNKNLLKMPRHFKCGLLPAPQPPPLHFAAYLKATLPQAPAVFGHQGLIPAKSWGMLGNDEVGDCAIAGPMHVEMLWNKMAGHEVAFTTSKALQAYSAITGYNPSNPSTDQGADMVQVAQYWQVTGMPDSSGNLHKISAFMQTDPSNLDHLFLAAYWFGAVGLGIEMPDAAEDQFTADEPWTVTGSSIDGYHYVPLVGRDESYAYVVTWGALQPVSFDFLKAYCQESVAYLSTEAMVNGRSLEGFDFASLTTDLQELME